MWLLLAASFIASTAFLERIFFYRRQEMRVPDFLSGILNLVRRKNYPEALDRCDEAHGPVAQVVHAAIRHHDLPKPELRELLQEVAQLQVPRLEQHLPLLATIGFLSPMIGLLGTVMGMISIFVRLQDKAGTATVADLAGGIWEALITTAAGLAIAIPCYAAYNYLLSRMGRIIRDMERAGIETLHALSEKVSIVEFEDSRRTQPTQVIPIESSPSAHKHS